MGGKKIYISRDILEIYFHMLGLEDNCFINLAKVAYEGWGSQMYTFLLLCDFGGQN